MRSVEEFRRVCRSDRMVWLDGGGSREWSSRRSLIGVLAADDISLVLRDGVVVRYPDGVVVGEDIFDVVEQAIAEDPEQAHWVGYVGYAARADLPGRRGSSDPADGVPDAVWMRVRDPLVIEEPRHNPPLGADLPPIRRGASPHSATSAVGYPAEYAAGFAEVQERLRAGDSYEVNLTYRETEFSVVEPAEAYLRLRASNPAPYAGFLKHGDLHLLSSSPECFATIDRNRELVARPIKGTTRRSADPDEDRRLAEHLASDPKLRAENLMITDLLRNDLSMVCEPGSVLVPSLMAVESYPSVHQLVTTVRGRLREDVSTLAALRALFPAGSMTGAPKRRTMEIIDAVETSPRGIYAGAFGWISGDGRADLGVVIRSLVATRAAGSGRPAGWRYELGTGGGITVRSQVEEEWAETLWKAERLRAAIHEPSTGGR